MTDGSVGLIITAASTASQFLTATPSTTYFLDLNPDGTWSWGTSHSAVTHHLTIASVTTDGSGNISTVTDARTVDTTVLSGMGGNIGVPNGLNFGAAVSGARSFLRFTAGLVQLSTPQAGSANGLVFESWTGTVGVNAFSVGGQYGSAPAWVDNSGNGYFTGGFVNMGASVGGVYPKVYWSTPIVVISPPASGAANGVVFQAWDGSTSYNPFSVGGQYGAAPAWIDKLGNYNGPVGGGIPTTRNGVATSAPIYTGSTTPSLPPTGALWGNV
jgi:hypothetical protein